MFVEQGHCQTWARSRENCRRCVVTVRAIERSSRFVESISWILTWLNFRSALRIHRKWWKWRGRLYKRFLASPWSFDSSRARIYLPDLFDRFSFYSSISPKLDVSNFQAWNTRENEAFTDYLSECNQRGAVKQCYLLATEGNYGCRFHEEF